MNNENNNFIFMRKKVHEPYLYPKDKKSQHLFYRLKT